MPRLFVLSPWLLPLLAGCSLFVSPPQPGPDATEGSAGGGAARVAEAAAAPPEGAVAAAPAVATREASTAADALFEFWKDPGFQRRFAESYLAESDYEPKVSASEREFLLEIADLLAAAGSDPATAQDRAIGMLQKRATGSASASLHFMLASLLFQRERLPEAAAAYETAVARHGAFRRAWKNLALVHMRLGNFGPATKALTRTVQLGGADALTYGLLGFALANADDHVGSESAYRMAAMLDPDTVDWRLGIARACFRQRRFGDAAALAGTLIARLPERADLWLLQANAYAGMNELGKAAENLEMVDRLGQSTVDSLHLLGDIYVNDDLPDLAASAYVRAIAADQRGEPGRVVRAAKALAARGALGECRQVVEAAEKKYAGRLTDEVRKDLLKLRARIAVAAGAGDEEARVLQEIVTLDPLDGEALILLGQYHQRRGEPELAVLQYERAAAIPASEADAKVRHAHLLVSQARYAEALPLLRRAQQLKPRDNVQQFLDQVERIAQGK